LDFLLVLYFAHTILPPLPRFRLMQTLFFFAMGKR